VFKSLYQSFAEVGGPAHGAARIAALRAELARCGLDGFIIPRSDEHQNEYVPPNAERLLWLTGFSGSAGIAIVLTDQAALFVDGRYTLQAPSQVDGAAIAVRHVVGEPPADWIAANLKAGGALGYDPWLHTPDAVARFAEACKKAGGRLVAVERNLVDAIRNDQPPPPFGLVSEHKLRYAGEASAAKIARAREALKDVEGLIVSDPHNLAWLFNIRGADVAHTPLPLGYAYLPKTGKPSVFLDGRKLSGGARKYLGGLADIIEPSELVAFVKSLGATGATIAFDSATAPARLTQTLESAGGKASIAADPLTLLKAAKNKTELAGARAAHARDAAALARFLAWFDREAPKGHLSEVDAAKALETFRRETGALKDVSFPSISAFGPHSAIPHYRVSDASNLRIARGLYLIDSGGQYEDGTTDITRTILVGRASAAMRDRFTRVLKGHIAIAEVVFPKGTTGAQIDSLARLALWRAGLDFDHGTGHGVGSYLSVHEGPQRIAKTGTVALTPGMIVSNEPGYYVAGEYGIRTENLVAVEERVIPGAEREMYGFETLSFAPIDLRLVEPKLLDAAEIAWLDAYHFRVRKIVGPLVDAPTRRWLREATRKLGGKAKR
jgi:Xaa-Pro aminopeptidase